MRMPPVFVHAGLVALSAIAAVSVFSRDKSKKTIAYETTIWDLRPSEIQHLVFEAKGKANKVTIEARSDSLGRWFFGTIDRAAHPKQGGALNAGFVSIGAGEKLFDTLAPLRALRNAGKLEGERIAELGLDEPEATLRVKLPSGERTLEIGSSTPGGSDRYARDPSSSNVYVVAGEMIRDLEWAESRLLERELHAFKETEIVAAKLVAGDKARGIVRRSEGGKTFWADVMTPDTSDETVGNFMQRLDRLRPSEYAETLPESRTTLVRVELNGKSGALGWVELVKVPTEGEKADYYIASERTRLHGKVVASLAQQVEQDIGSVIR